MKMDRASLKSEWRARFDAELHGASGGVEQGCDALLARLAELLADDKLQRAGALTWEHGQRYVHADGADAVDGLLSAVAAFEVLAAHGVPNAADNAKVLRRSAELKQAERDLEREREALLRGTAHGDLREAFDALTRTASADAAVLFLASTTPSLERERLVTLVKDAELADQLRHCWAASDASNLAKNAAADAKARELLLGEPPEGASATVESVFRFVDSIESAFQAHVTHASPALVQQLREKLDPLAAAIDARLAPFLDQIRSGGASTFEFRAQLRDTLLSKPKRTHLADPSGEWFAALLGWRTAKGDLSMRHGWGAIPSSVHATLSHIEQVRPTARDIVYDFGAGAGLVVELFALLSDATVRGIERDPNVVETARKTLDRLRLPNAAIVEGDVLVADWSDGTIFHMYQPFFEPIASEVCDRLVQLGRKKSITVCWRGSESFIAPLLAEVQARRWTVERGLHPSNLILRSQRVV